jgi:hypothetical protein
LTLESCGYSLSLEKTNSKYKIKKEFKNAREQEKHNIRMVFRNNYHKEDFLKYSGNIHFEKSDKGINIIYDNAETNISLSDSIYLELFKNKLLTPEMINCHSLDGHGLLINELDYVKKRHKKRFEVWVWQPNEMNPQVILIELMNKKSSKNSTLKDFIKESEVTFVYYGWIII